LWNWPSGKGKELEADVIPAAQPLPDTCPLQEQIKVNIEAREIHLRTQLKKMCLYTEKVAREKPDLQLERQNSHAICTCKNMNAKTAAYY
jgi:hypothetical protein